MPLSVLSPVRCSLMSWACTGSFLYDLPFYCSFMSLLDVSWMYLTDDLSHLLMYSFVLECDAATALRPLPPFLCVFFGKTYSEHVHILSFWIDSVALSMCSTYFRIHIFPACLAFRKLHRHMDHPGLWRSPLPISWLRVQQKWWFCTSLDRVTFRSTSWCLSHWTMWPDYYFYWSTVWRESWCCITFSKPPVFYAYLGRFVCEA